MLKQFNWLTTEELATALGIPVPTIQRWARMRVIPSIRIGHRTKFYDLEAVRSALQKRTVREVASH